jgi:N-methylhydantoinase B
MIESDYPIRVGRYGMVPDTGGPGRFRGGLALTREYEILAEDAILNVRSDKRRYPPHGLFGGKEGSPSINLINPGPDQRVLPVLMTEVEKLRGGDVYRHIMSGGGGFGDPHEREPARVLEDVLDEKMTPAHAEQAYGVVLATGPDGLAVDEVATAARRRQAISPA